MIPGKEENLHSLINRQQKNAGTIVRSAGITERDVKFKPKSKVPPSSREPQVRDPLKYRLVSHKERI